MIHLKQLSPWMKKKSSLPNSFHNHRNHYIRSESIKCPYTITTSMSIETVWRLAKPKHVIRTLIGRKNHFKRQTLPYIRSHFPWQPLSQAPDWTENSRNVIGVYSLIHRYGPLTPPLFFFLMGIIGKGKMCRNWICLLTLPKNVPRMFNMQISPPLCEKNVLAIYHLNSEIHE